MKRVGKMTLIKGLFSNTFWDFVQLLILLWNCVVIPLRLSFVEGYGFEGFSLFMFIIDMIFDFCYLLDIGFQKLVFKRKTNNPRLSSIVMPEIGFEYRSHTLRSGAKRLTKKEKSQKKRVRNAYFVADVISALPLDLLAYFLGSANPVIFRLFKLLRLLRLNEHFSSMTVLLEHRRLIVNAGFHRMVFLWIIFTVSAHWMSCGYFSVGYSELQSGNPSWVSNDGLMFLNATSGVVESYPGKTKLHIYVRSVYWAIITMVTVGMGDITPANTSAGETIFTLLTMYLGMSLTCMVIGNLTNIVTNLDHNEDEFHNRMDNLNKYMAYRHLSTDLRDRIRAYYTYMWTSLKGVNEDEFLSSLPVTLRLQVAGLQSRDLVKQVPFLRRAREPIINSICVALEQIIVSPGDCLVRKGQTMQGCLWLRRGEADSLGPDGVTVQQHLTSKTPTFFGDTSLFFTGSFENTIVANSYCELFFLKRTRFQEILKESCPAYELEELRAAAEKASKRNAKVKKFFGLDAAPKAYKGWKTIFEPNSRFREIWNLVMLISVGYNVINVPYRVATKTLLYTESVAISAYAFDWIFDLLFILDCFFRAFCFGFIREGIVIRDKVLVFRNYRKNQPWIRDVMIITPLDFIALVTARDNVLPLLRLPKLLRLAYFLGYYDIAQGYFAARRMTLTNSLHRIFKIFIGVIVIVHIVGCGWMLMAIITRYNALENGGGSFESDHPCSQTGMDWVCLDDTTWPGIDHSGYLVTYLRAVYFVLVDMTTVGYGDLVPINTLETAYAAIITLFGGLGYPAVVGAMAALIGSLNTARAEFRSKLSELTQYMATKKFPRILRLRINRYYDYLWSRQRGVDEDHILNDLPSPLRMEVQEYINGAIMRKISFLEDVDQELLRHLLSVLKPSVFLPNDQIISADEIGQVMFLLEKGATRVTSKDMKMTYAVLTPGDYFGEGCLLAACKRTASVIAIGYCDCFTLHRDDFDKVTKQFPKQRETVIAKLKETLKEKSKKNAAVYSNMQKHDKLSQITSYAYEVRSSIPESSWRHPESLKRRLWNLVILLIALYNLLLIPFRISLESVLALYFFDYTLDTFLLLDSVFHYKYFGYVYEGEVFADVDDIKFNYRKSKRFTLDSLICFPFDIFAVLVWASGVDTETILLCMAFLRLPKLLLVLRISPLVGNLDTLFEASRIQAYDASYRLFKLIVMVVSISHWTGCLFYSVAHYMTNNLNDCSNIEDPLHVNSLLEAGGCPLDSFYDTPGFGIDQLTCGITNEANCQWKDTWIEHQMITGLLPQDGGSLMHRYIRALNWALPTLVVVVIGDTIPVTSIGTLYVTIGIVIGVTINAAIIGSIANLVGNLEGSVARFRERMDRFEHFFYLYRIPAKLQARTRHYLEYVWETQKGVQQDQLVQDMPTTLRTEMSNFLKLSYIKNTPFFEFCDPALQKGLAASLTQQVYSPMDYIIYEGDLGNEMFFVEQGLVQLVCFRGEWRAADSNPNDRGSFGSLGSFPRGSMTLRRNSDSKKSSAAFVMGGAPMSRKGSSSHGESIASRYVESSVSENDVIVLGTLENGSYFGETAVFFNERRCCSARAIDYTQVYSLHKDAVNEVLSRYPHDDDHMFEILNDLRTKNLLRNENLRYNIEKMLAAENKKLSKMIGKRMAKSGSIFGGFKAISSAAAGSLMFGRGSSTVAPETTGSIVAGEGGAKTSDKLAAAAVEKAMLATRLRKGSKVFNPTSTFCLVWNVFSLLFTLYFAWSIPYRVAFYVDGLNPFEDGSIPAYVWAWLSLEYLIDVFFFVDIYFRFSRFAINRFGKIIKSRNEISRNYRDTWMVYDVIASFPADLIVFLFIKDATITTYSTVRLIRLVRLTRLGTYVRIMDRYLSDLSPRLNSAMLQAVKLFVLMLLLNHWLACSWFALHRFVEPNDFNTWAIADGLATFSVETQRHNVFNSDLTPMFCYLRAFYFTVTTMSSVGYGDIRPYTLVETIHELIVVITGACTFAALIGSVAVVFLYSDSKGEKSFKGKLRKLLEYMEYRELPQELQGQIVKHFTQRWERFEGIELHDITSELPLPLQLELSICVHRDIIHRVRGLRRCHLHVQRHLARKLEALVTCAKEYVYREGDIGREIYFILKGECTVSGTSTMQRDARKKLKPGNHFGGDTLYSISGERRESIQCCTDCEMYFISKHEFEVIVQEFPEHRTVGIFAELIHSDRKTVTQAKEDREAINEITSKVKNNPLARFSSRHIDNLLSFTNDRNQRKTCPPQRVAARAKIKPAFTRSATISPLSAKTLGLGTQIKEIGEFGLGKTKKEVLGKDDVAKEYKLAGTAPVPQSQAHPSTPSRKKVRRVSSTFEDAEELLLSTRNESLAMQVEPQVRRGSATFEDIQSTLNRNKDTF